MELTRAQKDALDVALRLITAVDRAEQLGWHSISVKRLLAITEGVESAMLPDPATAPPSAFSAGARQRRLRETTPKPAIPAKEH